MIAVLVLGLPPEAVILFEVLLNGTSLFNHGNVRLPDGVDRVLRLFVVTPDMHRVHHSIHRAETNSNFGFNFPGGTGYSARIAHSPRQGIRK